MSQCNHFWDESPHTWHIFLQKSLLLSTNEEVHHWLGFPLGSSQLIWSLLYLETTSHTFHVTWCYTCHGCSDHYHNSLLGKVKKKKTAELPDSFFSGTSAKFETKCQIKLGLTFDNDYCIKGSATQWLINDCYFCSRTEVFVVNGQKTER